MIHPEQIIVRQIVTEKATEASSHGNQYYFHVVPEANRVTVKQAIEKQFSVDVQKVNILNVKPKMKPDRRQRGKFGRKPGYKRAIIRLKEGQTIDFA
ncbi:MAG: 50S ribosomal protein L23 [Opitutales bacterium]|nr:50S ribosomal protein L23 [Opitutales bacterium]